VVTTRVKRVSLLLAYAVVNPEAVMVKILDAPLTYEAMS
jgi:hypothetical protein